MDKIFNLYLKFFLLGCMVFYIPGMPFYIPQEMFFQYGIMGLLGVCYFVPRKRSISNFYLGLILLYALANTVFFRFNPPNRMVLLNMFFGFILIKELAERVDLNFKSIGNLLALFCALNTLWLGLQIHNYDPIFSSVAPENMPQVDVVGFMGLKSNLGTLAALSFPFIFMASPLASIIVIPLLWFGKSSAAILSVVITLLFMLWFKSKKAFWISLVVIGLSGLAYILKVDMPSGEFSKRIPVWFAGIRMAVTSSPWFGTGLGNWALTQFTTIQKNGEPQVWLWAHNQFVQYFYELGLFGLITLYAYFKNLFSKVKFSFERHIQAVSLFIPLVLTSFIHFPFHIARFAGLGCFMIACIEALLVKDSE